MDCFGEAEYQLYWDTNMFFHSQEPLDSWGLEESLSTYYDSSSPDGTVSQLGSKNIVSERNRRKKLNERLFALRAVVPNISKMDKASIIRDAITHIQELREQQQVIKSEISNLEKYKPKSKCNNSPCSIDYYDNNNIPFVPTNPNNKKKRVVADDDDQKHYFGSNRCSKSSSIDDLEMRVSYVGEKTMVVSMTCSKKEGSLVKLCESFEALKLKIITAHITAFSGRLLKTVFFEVDEGEKDHLVIKIEAAMSSVRV
ncbi:hypothetical protein vseg_000320 [Gypsophila vaccaria]